MKYKTKEMDRSLLVYCFGLISILFFSCERENIDYIGPELYIASPSFEISSEFQSGNDVVNFAAGATWFEAEFNELTSWTITVRGLTSGASKIIKGSSKSLNQNNTSWTGGHSGLYFFDAGEKAVAELTVFGKTETWTDTMTITGEKTDYGSNVIVWWDMEDIGVARNGADGTLYWFDFFDQSPSEKVQGFMDELQTDKPVQGGYRSIEGKDGIGPTDYFVGAVTHGGKNPPVGFNDASLDEVYLNFYVRRRTNTSGLAVEISSDVGGETSTLYYNVGEISWTGWRLVSEKLSNMEPGDGHPTFDPSSITTFLAAMQTVTSTTDQTGFDLDFISITKGAPFNPDKY